MVTKVLGRPGGLGCVRHVEAALPDYRVPQNLMFHVIHIGYVALVIMHDQIYKLYIYISELMYSKHSLNF